MMSKLWGGRFAGGLDPIAWEFNASLSFDWRLAEVDIRGSIAWSKALMKAGVITLDEQHQISKGLTDILAEVRAGKFTHAPTDEDVHTAIERRLIELVGPVGGKLHTGRSRNDQVATDFALWIVDAIDRVDAFVKLVQTALVERAERDMGIILPGYTHFQQSQPILLSHWWLSHFWPLARDRQRLAQLRERAAVLPLGSGALAGTPFPIDRKFLANQLGFKTFSPNSIDAVSNRDSAAEFLFTAVMIAIHLSRLAEMLILYTSAEFGFIELSDAYSTGSSLMPQKKNPDTLELTRGKAGTMIGRLTGLLAVLKGLPSAYDKDLQEDKVPVFEATDTLCLMLPVVAGVLQTLIIRPEKMEAALNPAMLATDLADYLVNKGIPFREAHRLVGLAVRRAAALEIPLSQLPLAEFQSISPAFEKDIAEVFNFQASIARRNSPGGTSPAAVQVQLQQARAFLDDHKTRSSIPASQTPRGGDGS
ncbi:argininosuccinate lyase [Anaerolinea thermolimosa]|uniref:argininosuccinate lyase n=1 Tax=Anaerolinea thermolimosa TaxID=229919 RepID=UPI0013B46DCC